MRSYYSKPSLLHCRKILFVTLLMKSYRNCQYESNLGRQIAIVTVEVDLFYRQQKLQWTMHIRAHWLTCCFGYSWQITGTGAMNPETYPSHDMDVWHTLINNKMTTTTRWYIVMNTLIYQENSLKIRTNIFLCYRRSNEVGVWTTLDQNYTSLLR